MKNTARRPRRLRRNYYPLALERFPSFYPLTLSFVQIFPNRSLFLLSLSLAGVFPHRSRSLSTLKSANLTQYLIRQEQQQTVNKQSLLWAETSGRLADYPTGSYSASDECACANSFLAIKSSEIHLGAGKICSDWPSTQTHMAPHTSKPDKSTRWRQFATLVR